MGAYKSNAQRKKFHAMESRGEVSHAEVATRDAASKGRKLPEHVRAHRRASKQMASEGIAMQEHGKRGYR